MKQHSQKEQLQGMMKYPIPKKKVGVVRLQMIKESKVLYGMERFQRPCEAADMIRPLVKTSDREMLLVMSVDSMMQPMALEIVAVGGVSYCSVDIKNLFKHALLNNASHIICFHNHPSGDPKASYEDKRLTWTLRKAGEILGITVLDHIIVGDDSYYSLKEQDELDDPCKLAS